MATTLYENIAIVAIATASGRAALGVIRVSGQGLEKWVKALLGQLPQARCATLLPFRDAQGITLDQGLALWFPAPHSYTGEDVLELQAHGGPVVLQLLVERCLEVAREINWPMRLAEPGEFSKRAFLNEKLDLAQAEAVVDLINASTGAAAKAAARSLMGAFSLQIETLLQQLTQLRMLVEATLDFPDEEIDFLERDDAYGQWQRLYAQLQQVQKQTKQGALLREGMTVVIVGQPNAGKSSLLNALAGQELAIVTPVAGTTRDVIGQTLQIEGVPIHVRDTAGLRDSDDVVERMGIERAWCEIKQADVLLWVRDASQASNLMSQQREEQMRSQWPQDIPCLEVWNKIDLVDDPSALTSQSIKVSALTHQGLDDLRQQLLSIVGWQATEEAVSTARQRHVEALRQVAFHLKEAGQFFVMPHLPLDLLAEELRLAQQALSAITGRMSADQLLGEIFSSFCIGK